MASILCHMLILPKNPTNYLTTFDRKIAKKNRFISCNAASITRNCDQTASITRNCDQTASITRNCDQTVMRRSANYSPPIWDFEFIQSLNSEYTGERYLSRASELKVQVKTMLEDAMETLYQLELIDDLQRMGISYHFEDEINRILTSIYQKKYGKNEDTKERDLYSTALEFRLLRQHDFSVSQDIFDSYKNENGDFMSSLHDDTKGLLQLYEASYMLIEGEKTLEVAREFATIFLRKNLDEGHGHTSDQNLTLMVVHALELPLHWRIQRPNARWFIDAYERREDVNLVLLEFAKLDFNILQATHQQELKQVSRWWKSTCLAENMPFARDRLVESYIWTLIFAPYYGDSRIMATKVNALITVIDDAFDVHGTMEELQLFNNTIQRWDIGALDQLPRYMQMSYLALDNFINEMAYDVLKEHGIVIIPYLRKLWKDLSKAYLQEANWYSTGYTPTMEEYINNAWISAGCSHVTIGHAFFLLTNPIDKETIQCLYKYHDILRWSGMLLRLANDLGTSPEEMERGDVPKSIQCYMNETSASREEAGEHVKLLIYKTWKNMNKERVANSPFSHTFVRSVVNFGRMAQYMYQHGDGHGNHNPGMKERISKLLFEPIE